MPHYKDGTEAKVGDIVRGVPYNTQGKEVVGEVIQVIPGSDSCNLIVAFVRSQEIASVEDLPWGVFNIHGVSRYDGEGGAKSAKVALSVGTDYGATSDFEKIVDAPVGAPA